MPTDEERLEFQLAQSRRRIAHALADELDTETLTEMERALDARRQDLLKLAQDLRQANAPAAADLHRRAGLLAGPELLLWTAKRRQAGHRSDDDELVESMLAATVDADQ